MRLLHLAAVLTTILMTGVAWAQRSPDVDNRVPELRVTELLQSGNSLKVTVRNVSTRTIRGVSAVLGKHKVDQDWSALAGGGVIPNATASLTISMAGLPAGGTRHHPAAPPSLELSSAVFADTGRGVPQAPKAEIVEQQPPAPLPSPPVKAKPVPISSKAPARVESNPGTPKVEVAPPAVAAPPTPRAQTAPPPAFAAPPTSHAQTEPPATAATPPPRVQTAPLPAPESASPTAMAPRERATPPPSESVQQDQHPATPPAASAPPRPTGHAGTREQGVLEELSQLLSLIQPYETDLASTFPRTALRKMIAAVVAEQNAWAASQPAVTPFDQGQRSAVETFVYGLQAIHERRDLDDQTLRAQVQRFLKNRRQSLNR